MKRKHSKKKKIRTMMLASQKKTKVYEKHIDKILEAIAIVLDEPTMQEALTTDESSLWDFMPSMNEKEVEYHVKMLSDMLKVKVKKDDYLVEIAERMK